MTAIITELPRATLQDVPTVLRSIADQLESGVYGPPLNAVVVTESKEGRIEVFGAGSFNEWLHSIALLHLGINEIVLRNPRHHQNGEGPTG